MLASLVSVWLTIASIEVGQGSTEKVDFSEQPIVPTHNSSETSELGYSSLQSTLKPSLLQTLDDEVTQCISPWTCCGNESGECKEQCNNGTILLDIMKCDSHKKLTVLKCYCATYNDEDNVTEVGPCLYDCISGNARKSANKSLYIALPSKTDLNNFTCGNEFNRAGTLCGRCQHEHHLLVDSFDMSCMKCPNSKSNWWKYVFAVYSPLTVFFFVVLFFKINVTSSHLHGFIFYSQAISLPTMMRTLLLTVRQRSRVLSIVRYIAGLYGIWNLDFFRSLNVGAICLGTDSLQMLSLDFIVGAYPLLLMVVSYFLIELYDRNFKPLVILWKPFSILFGVVRKNWEIRTSLIDAFATFFVLSNMKFLSVSFDLLVPIRVYQINSTGDYHYTFKLYYDATVPYFGSRHLPFAIPALLVLAFFVLLPGLLLIVYPMRPFQRLLNLFPVRWYILHTFMDSFQGCYKDGTEPGTRDCRWFASLFFLSRLFLMCIGAFTLNSNFFAVAAISLVLLALLFIIVEPFKRNVSHFTDINVIFILLLALWYVSLAGIKEADARRPEMLNLFFTIGALTGIFPLLYISTITIIWIYRNGKFGLKIFQRLQAWRLGYDLLE